MPEAAAPRHAPADDATRLEVVERLASFLVQAPAGSGKTELLIQRYLRLLAEEGVQEPEQVVAITFTRKAAAEMRNRVLQALAAAGGPPPEGEHERRARAWAELVAARDRERGWRLLENPSRLEIRTVDALGQWIVAQSPHAAGLGHSMRIADDLDALYHQAALRCARLLVAPDATIAAAVERLFTAADNNLARFQRLMEAMLKRREQWMPLLKGRAQQDPDAVRIRLEQALADAARSELRHIRNTLEATLSADERALLLHGARYAAGNVGPDSNLCALAGMDDLPADEPEQFSLWLALAELLFTEKSELRKTVTVAHGFPPGALRRHKDDFADLLKQLAARCGPQLAELCHRLRELPPPRYSEEQWDLLRALFTVLPRAVDELRSVFAERDLLDYSQVAQAALLTLGPDGQLTPAGRDISIGIRHLLVDEFQDTSLAQVELLKCLTAAWQPDDGRTVFLVGDPMQSIYSFRQAEVTLFADMARRGLPNRKPELRVIAANFRSQARLVEWFNQTFAQVLTEDHDLTGAVSYRASVAFREAADDPACEVHAFDTGNEQREAEFIVETIERELAHDAQSKVAILVRARTHLPLIVEALTRRGIRFRAKDVDELGSRPAVRDLAALTRALLHLGDRVAWIALLRGPCCGLTLADLWVLFRDDDTSAAFDLMRERQTQLSSDGQARVRRVLAILEPVLAERGRLPLARWVESAWLALGGPAAVRPDLAASDQRDAGAYLDLLAQCEVAGDLPDLRRFREQLDKLWAPPETAPDVRVEIMTIHLAKGLQFDVVIVPALEREPLADMPQLLRWRRRVLDGRDDLLLAPSEEFPKRNDKTATLESYLKLLDEDCEREERKRVLYVAATRAQRKLYLTYTRPEGAAPHGSLLRLIENVPAFRASTIPHHEAAAGAQPQAPQRTPAPFRRLPAVVNWPQAPAPLAFTASLRPQAGREPRHTFEWVEQTFRHVGTVTHRFLQQIARDGLDRWAGDGVAARRQQIRAALLSQGVDEAQLPAAAASVAEALSNTLADERGRWLLGAHAEQHSERELSAEIAGDLARVKLDRTFLEADGTRWIVDFKTTRQEGGSLPTFLDAQCEKYRPDLERYRQILQLDPAAGRIRLGLYFPLQRAWREL